MDDADTTRTNTVSADRTEISSESRRILGLPLERALELVSAINVAALLAVAIAGAFIAVTAYFIIKWQGEIQMAKDSAFETYKLGVAAQVAEAKKEGIEAGKIAGNALVRAEELRAANLALESQIAPRRLDRAQQQKIADSLVKFAGLPVAVVSYTQDAESAILGQQIMEVLQDARLPPINKLASVSPLGNLAGLMMNW
jgi:hypothetical protein